MREFLLWLLTAVVSGVAMWIGWYLAMSRAKKREQEFRAGWTLNPVDPEWKPKEEEIPEQVYWLASLFPLYEPHMLREAKNLRREGFSWKWIIAKIANDIESQNPGLLDRMQKEKEYRESINAPRG